MVLIVGRSDTFLGKLDDFGLFKVYNVDVWTVELFIVSAELLVLASPVRVYNDQDRTLRHTMVGAHRDQWDTACVPFPDP